MTLTIKNYSNQLLLLTGFLLVPALVFSQKQLPDSNRNGKKTIRVNWNVEGGNYYLSGAGEKREVEIPQIISLLREDAYRTSKYNPNLSLDNPLGHNAMYIRFRSETEIAPNVILYGDLTGEHRGFSYGTFATSNMVVFPQIRIEVKRGFNLTKDGAHRINFDFKAGNFRNIRLNEGLMLYNLDAQGMDINFRYKKWRYRIFSLGDLTASIGLGINDTWNHIWSYEDIRINKKWKAVIAAGSYNHLDVPLQGNKFGPQLSMAIFTKNTRIYTQTAFNGNILSDVLSNVRDYAFLAGIKQQHQGKKLRLQSVMEYRFYGGLFNQGYKTVNSPDYRQSRVGNAYGQTVGSHLYPLYQYERPFSQWAVFTEYQNHLGSLSPTVYRRKNVGGATWQLNVDYKPYRELLIHGNVDLNHIMAEDAENFTYAFTTIGIGLELGEHTRLMYVFSNKGMNLDVNYPTFYQYSSFLTGLSFSRKLKE